MTDLLLGRLFPHDVHHVAGMHDAIGRAIPERGRVLDLGCGINTDLEDYRTLDREVWGTDFQAHPDLRHGDWFRLLKSDGAIPFPHEHFDTIAAVMVLEHVVEPARFLGEIARTLRPSGRFVGHTISGTHYVTAIRRLMGVLPHAVSQRLVKWLYGRAEVDTFPAFYRMNTERRVKRFADATGLRLVDVRRYADPGYFRFARPLAAAAVVADRMMETVCPGFGRLYVTFTLEKPG